MLGRSRRAGDRALHRCGHLGTVRPVEPSSTSCEQCLHLRQDWMELWMCLSCGWVACSDDSPRQHARAHYEETDHPIAVPLPYGSQPRWCHVDQRAV